MQKRIIALSVAIGIGMAGALPLGAHTLVERGSRPGIARSSLSARPSSEWNRLSRSGGKNAEVWTLDGEALNKVSFYAGVESGKTLLRKNKRHPAVPRVSDTMLMTDIPALLETTYRSLGLVNQMSIDEQVPATLANRKAIRFSYTLTRTDDEVRRRGEGIGALVDGKLYLITYEAPALHFFDRDLARYRELTASLSL